MSDVPNLLHTVLDAVDVRAEAEFWRRLLGLAYRAGDEVPDDGGDDADWLVLLDADGGRGLAIQEVDAMTPTRWPEPGHPSVSHLDTIVATREELDEAHERVLSLGGELRLDRTDDPDEPLRAYASPAGHVFCVFVAPSADAPRGRFTGTCAFRMMPTDDLVAAPSTLALDAAAGGAQLLTYTWLHPEDGEQAGSLLLGAAAPDGAVTAAWTDTWHQRDLTLLTGVTRGPATTVGYDYAPGWRWEVDVVLDAPPGVGMVMRNVVPEDQDEPAGAYDVMRARWT